MLRKLENSELMMYKFDINILIQVDFIEEINITYLRQAIEKLKFIHKMSSCTIIKRNKKLYFKQIDKNLISQKNNFDINTLINQELNYKFSDGEQLTRIHYLTTSKNKKSSLIFNFSHVISDARSALEYTSDLICQYKNLHINKANKQEFPQAIETYFPKKSLPNILQTHIDNLESNKGDFKKYYSKTINNFNVSLSKILKESDSSSFSSMLSALALKTYSTLISEKEITRYLNIDLRTIFKLSPCLLSFYSIGIPEHYNNVHKKNLNELTKEIEKNLYKNMASETLLKNGLSHNHHHANTCSISYIKNQAITRLEQINMINNIKIYGNCFSAKRDSKKIFILFLKFKDKMNINLHYDDQNLNETIAKNIITKLATEIEKLNQL